MPKKCESCRHFKHHPFSEFERGFCRNSEVTLLKMPDGTGGMMPIDQALKICDRENNGTFVYFEPKTPAAGAAVSEPPASAGGQFVQITRTHHPRALKAAV